MRCLFLALIMITLFQGCSRERAGVTQVVIPLKATPSQYKATLNEFPMGSPIYLRIFKEEKLLELWVEESNRFTLYKTYPIQKASGKLGPKQKEGDKQNPEGIYAIGKQNLNPYSKYYLSMNIGYPNRLDRNLRRTGHAIMIHGGCTSIGCFAMGDEAIEEIYTIAYNALENGQKFFYVAIYPFKMKEKNLRKYTHVAWYPFWENLKEGYELFNKERIPPHVTVRGEKYIFKTSQRN